MRVCAALGIPFREIDLSDEYKTEVVERMVGDYARGVTPNPDVCAINTSSLAPLHSGQKRKVLTE